MFRSDTCADAIAKFSPRLFISNNGTTIPARDFASELTSLRHQPMAHQRRVTKTVPGNLNRVGVHLTNNRSISSNSTMADPFEPTSPPPTPEPIPPNPNPPPEPP